VVDAAFHGAERNPGFKAQRRVWRLLRKRASCRRKEGKGR
jgi:hypothetical protein